jgi:hypothetical protein
VQGIDEEKKEKEARGSQLLSYIRGEEEEGGGCLKEMIVKTRPAASSSVVP